MKAVEPIRDKKTLDKMKGYLMKRSARDHCLFTVGINSGLRISDLLGLQIKDILTETGKVRKRITVKEKKTGKPKDFPICDTAAKAIQQLLSKLDTTSGDNYLFSSRKGNQAITRGQAWRILNEAASFVGIDTDMEPIGTHTMRKTFGYHAYKQGRDLSVIQKLLNHSSPAITLAYIGITKDDLDEVYLNLNL